MNILVLNVGSSSIKFSVFKDEELLYKDSVERIGGEESSVKTFNQGFRIVTDRLKKNRLKIDAIGHRIVHGGSLVKPCLISKNVVNEVKKYSGFAQLHNGNQIEVIDICSKMFPKLKQVAVFDTGFHQTMPEYASTYAIPNELTAKYKIRRYGFHGINHKYVAVTAAELLKKKIAQLKIVSCHLGNGCSVTAVDRGKSIDTTMGFTPLEGLVMGTRSGSIDPTIITFLMDEELYTTDEILAVLNRKSGLLGISGISNDVAELKKSKDKKAALALDVFSYSIIKSLASMISAMNGVDAICFSGGIGENAYYIREKVMKNFEFLGVKLDKKKNAMNERIISDAKSKVKILVIPANESLMIAKEVKSIVKKP